MDRDNRQLCELRGKTRDYLDNLLLNELMETGVGRSAFICAAVDFLRGSNEDGLEKFVKLAKLHEARLRLEAPGS